MGARAATGREAGGTGGVVRVTWQIICADVLEGLRGLEDESVHCCVTSPPYWGLRDYGVPGQLGLEPVLSCGILEVGLMELRDDLTPEQREYVIVELSKNGLL